MKIPTLALVIVGAGLASTGSAQQDFEKTIPVPRTGIARLNWTSGKCSVESLELRNYPDADDVDKARHKDPDDHSWLWWQFDVENRGDEKCHIKLWVEVLDKSGSVLKSGDRSDSVDAHKLDDNIRVSTRMRTIDIADAPKVRLRGSISAK